MTIRWYPISAMIFAILATPALAQEAPVISGNWGNEAGCAFVKGGTRDDEGIALLTAEKYEDYVTYCDFVQVLKGPGALVITALCGHEGEDAITAETLIVRKPADGSGLMLTDAAGNERGRFEQCR